MLWLGLGLKLMMMMRATKMRLFRIHRDSTINLNWNRSHLVVNILLSTRDRTDRFSERRERRERRRRGENLLLRVFWFETRELATGSTGRPAQHTDAYLHIGSPKSQVSGLEWSSMRTVGMQTISTNRSAIDRLMRNKLVEFLKYFVLITTNGTRRFPQTPTLNISRQNSVAIIRM